MGTSTFHLVRSGFTPHIGQWKTHAHLSQLSRHFNCRSEFPSVQGDFAQGIQGANTNSAQMYPLDHGRRRCCWNGSYRFRKDCRLLDPHVGEAQVAFGQGRSSCCHHVALA